MSPPVTAALPAAKALDASDAEDVRPDALDLRSKGDEEPAEVLDVRLARRVGDHGLAFGEHRRHHDVLRSGHRGLVQEDARCEEALRPHRVAAVHVDVSAELRKGMDVRVQPAAADHVASRRRDDRLPLPGEQRSCQENRGPDAAAEFLVELPFGD
jgi:hypothetical protein